MAGARDNVDFFAGREPLLQAGAVNEFRAPLLSRISAEDKRAKVGTSELSEPAPRRSSD